MLSDDIVISARNLGKTYRLFGHPGERIKQFFSFGLRRYHRKFTALSDVSFDIRRGEAIGIVGPNGSGKSTLLQLVCGILRPTNGSIEVHGRVSALLELGAGFNPEFTGRENVYFQGSLMGLSRRQIAAFADIGEFIDQPVRAYSSGMFVRLAFATMIHADADILVIDEALAVGDEAFQRKCFDKLSEILADRNKILILVSHNTRQIERVCSRVLWLQGGQLLQDETSRTVCNAYMTSMHHQLQSRRREDGPQPSGAPSGELDVSDIWLCSADDDAPLDAIHPNAPLRVVFQFLCHVDLSVPDVIVEIQTIDQIPIAAANTGRLAQPPSFRAGDSPRLECLFPNVPLQPGVYQIKLVFLDKFRQYFFSFIFFNWFWS